MVCDFSVKQIDERSTFVILEEENLPRKEWSCGRGRGLLYKKTHAESTYVYSS